MNERINKQLDFILEVNKEKNILRRSYKCKGERENDAEHSWHMALMLYLLKEYANEEIDIAKVMIMALIHDVVEIDAGDTYAYDLEGLSSQKEREQKAAERIFGLLPDDQKKHMIELFNEFEEYETPEARYAHVIDNLQPILLNDLNNGESWREHGVKKSQVYKRNSKTESCSKELWEVIKKIIDNNIKKGNIKDA